jgi:hypothetical protein
MNINEITAKVGIDLTEGLEFRNIVNAYPEYGLRTVELYFKGLDGEYRPSGRKWILKGNRAIADVSQRYKLIPNEEVLKVADRLAEAFGFKQHRVSFSKDGNFMMAKYISSQKTINPDNKSEINLGFSVRNSIDGRSGLGVDGFTFRYVCTNGAIIELSMLPNVRTHRKHTQIADLQSLERIIGLVVGRLGEIAELYKSWVDAPLTTEQFIQLIRRIPQKYLPAFFDVEGTKKALVEGQPITPPNMTTWEAYNAITDVLSHNEKIDARSEFLYNYQLHAALIRA